MGRFLLICGGGALGTGARYLLSTWLAAAAGTGFPWGTLAVNVVGSFLIGAINFVGLNSELISPTTRLALTTGIMGGFTTYSTFNYETLRFFAEGAALRGSLNVLVTLLGCAAAGLAGLAVGRAFVGS
jgi:CrcB protein